MQLVAGDGVGVYLGTNTHFYFQKSGPSAPACSTNCGTSPSVSGNDHGGIITMGATGSPASGFVLTFASSYPTSVACTVHSAKAGMAAGKAPLNVIATATTLTVETAGTAPGNNDQYTYLCIGVA
jgi:hypothetical protein